MLLSELLTPDRIQIPLRSRTKDELLRELVQVAEHSGAVGDAEVALRAVQEREATLSTGIGNGIAIPHGRSDSVRTLVLAAGVTQEPVPFAAFDGEPVRLAFLLLSPEGGPASHVQALGRIARALRSEATRERLLAAREADDFHAVIAEAEAGG